MYKNKKTFVMLLVLIAILFILIGIYLFILKFYLSKDAYISDDSFDTHIASALNSARQAMENNQGMLKSMPEKKIPENIKIDKGAIKIVQEPNFQEVAEKPKTQIEFLQEMANAKKKPVMELEESDLNKKVNLYYQSNAADKVPASYVPEFNVEEDLKTPKKTMISAPVEYKIFKNEKDWQEFANSHRIRKIEPDFKNSYVLILVSTSELPNGIFKIDSLKKENGGVTVLYRVDPLEMAADNSNSTPNHYSAINIPKTDKIQLKQIP